MITKIQLHVFFLYLNIFLSFPVNISTADEGNLPIFYADDLHDYKITKTEFFKGKELYGYINGGAEIFLEYGFEKLAVQYLQSSLNEYKIEIYQMSDHEAAFGMYSISRHFCEVTNTLTKFYCNTPYQLLIAKGPFYITVTNFIGDSVSQNESVFLGKILMSKINIEEFSIPDGFRHPFQDKYRDNLIFVRGPLGLQSRLSFWSDLFAGFSNYSVFVVQIDNGDNWARAAQISLQNQKDIQLFFKRIKIENPSRNKDKWRMHLSPDIWQTARYQGDKNLFFVEATKDYKDFQMLLESMNPEDW